MAVHTCTHHWLQLLSRHLWDRALCATETPKGKQCLAHVCPRLRHEYSYQGVPSPCICALPLRARSIIPSKVFDGKHCLRVDRIFFSPSQIPACTCMMPPVGATSVSSLQCWILFAPRPRPSGFDIRFTLSASARIVNMPLSASSRAGHGRLGQELEYRDVFFCCPAALPPATD